MLAKPTTTNPTTTQTPPATQTPPPLRKPRHPEHPIRMHEGSQPKPHLPIQGLRSDLAQTTVNSQLAYNSPRRQHPQ